MRYFNNAQEDRRVLISSPSVGGSSNAYELTNAARTISETSNGATSSNAHELANAASTMGKTPSPNAVGVDRYDNTGSNKSKIRDAIDNGNTNEWLKLNAKTAPEKEFDLKYGETSRNEDGSVNKEAMIQKIVDSHMKDGMNLDGFSVQGFMAADNNGRISMLRIMQEQYNANEAAKSEEYMRLARERDAARAARNNPSASNPNVTGQVLNTLLVGAQLYLSSKK